MAPTKDGHHAFARRAVTELLYLLRAWTVETCQLLKKSMLKEKKCLHNVCQLQLCNCAILDYVANMNCIERLLVLCTVLSSVFAMCVNTIPLTPNNGTCCAQITTMQWFLFCGYCVPLCSGTGCLDKLVCAHICTFVYMTLIENCMNTHHSP